MVSGWLSSWVFKSMYLPPLIGSLQDATLASTVRDLASFNGKVILACLTPDLLAGISSSKHQVISGAARQQATSAVRSVLVEFFQELDARYWIEHEAQCHPPASLLAWVEQEIRLRGMAAQ